jgi:LPPG:FO 2-phospho-L-lactate transferase
MNGVIALSGGVGGAKLAHGLAQCLAPSDLTIIVNTGDDFEHLGFTICPDIDTVLYTLAGVADRERGWGRRDETWHFMGELARRGGPTWFRLGDRDLATHAFRTTRLREGESLSAVTARLASSFGVAHAVLPMADEPVRTRIVTREGALEFQDWFVRQHCEPRVERLEFTGAEAASPGPRFAELMRRDDARAIVLCPSNPYLSIDPILAVPGVRAWLARTRSPVIAVSPIVGGQALKGPAATMLRDLAGDASVLSIARHYAGLIDTLVIDGRDADSRSALYSLGIQPLVTDTVMKSEADRARLAATILEATCQRRAS